MRGPRRLIAVLFAAALVGAVAYPAFADALASKVNASRSGSLPIYSVADSVAQGSAQAQAANQRLTHDYADLSRLSGSCTAAGEVVGVGPNIDAIFKAFRNSPEHWRLITSPDWTSMGTGQATDTNGTLYVSVVFCRGAGGDSSPTPPKTTTTTTTTTRTGAATSAPVARAPARRAPKAQQAIERPLHPELRMQIVRLLPRPLTVCFGEEIHDVVIDVDRVAIACPDVY